jgi:nucleoside-diphosphate-sugar epimerase
MVKGILKVSHSPKISGEILNLGSGKEIKIIELAKLILKLTESDSKIEFHPLPPDDPKRRCPDTSKAEQIIKWKVETNLKEGLNKTISYLRKNNQLTE